MQSETLWADVRREEDALAGAGRILVRPSGTEALIRVMVEAKTLEIANEVAQKLVNSINSLKN
jgi:phosphoglucosamine mutase